MEKSQAPKSNITTVNIASKAKRRACSTWQHQGCLLDAMEKLCEEDIIGASTGPFKPDGLESVYMCCCPEPYLPCNRSTISQVCLTSLNASLSNLFSSDSKVTPNQAMHALQQVRADLLVAGGTHECEAVFAKPEPMTGGCGDDPTHRRSLDRADLFCEMLTWQLEELGDGDRFEFEGNGCPFVDADRNLHGQRRKGHAMMVSGDLFLS
eukprot:gnl/TRDRNA2_/TRDRNA2_44798_c0_seq1.p1 gnl/TRDRNA2_/TRDRNA2_44798_c0~~gnl/TRDRNA2_/TRDRNA2_44798_c0_seq1.p1  ORF type:complete len:209 (-),score=24.49 gnl/TRDRNA2_/TRDRNA2_44798_c0_seq1:70-696(-)